MDPQPFYSQQLNAHQTVLQKLQSKKSAFAWLRFGAIAGIFLVFYFLWSAGAVYVISGTLLLIIVFFRLVYIDLGNHQAILHTKRLIKINEDEMTALNGDYFHFASGAEHLRKDHPYANDLDILGRASLFQYLNRTTSEKGSSVLADYLLAPASIAEIDERQKGVKELSAKMLWIQNLISRGITNPITTSSIKRLSAWMEEPPLFSKFKPWKWLRYALPALILSIIILFILEVVGVGLLYLFLFVFAAIAYQINKYVSPVHEKLNNIAKELNTLTESILLIENERFESKLLQELQASFLLENKKASQKIRGIQKILDRLDLRYNLVLSAPLNLLLLWNLQQMLDLEKWKSTGTASLEKWFDSLGVFEALNSFAILHFNHPSWTFPKIYDDYFSIKGTEIGHPLIPAIKRVNNYISIPSNGELMLVTGSNMAGKSTYLRSIGVNSVLAMAGAPVCAAEFSISHINVISSMRVSDNLEESTSTFYAELKKLKTIIDEVNAGKKVFILLDEILRGTNSLDRHTGSKALIEQFIKNKTAAIIATHDLELAELSKSSGQILNYHFDVQVENEELYFDYKLKPGICTSLNASILMKKIGIEL